MQVSNIATGAQTPQMLLQAFRGSWIRSRAASTQTNTPIGGQSCQQKLPVPSKFSENMNDMQETLTI